MAGVSPPLLPSHLLPDMQPHASLAVDVIVLTIAEQELITLLVKVRNGPFAGRWAFPGGLVGVGESLEEAGASVLHPHSTNKKP